MQLQQFVPWDNDKDEVIFSSHTALISIELLREKLEEQGVDLKGFTKEAEGTETQPEDKSHTGAHMTVEEKRLLIKSQMRSSNLYLNFDTGLPESSKNLKRVTVEALDMDWIFYEDNAKTLLEILSDSQNEKVLTKKSIRTFINFMWKYYQSAIIRRIFFPYVLYLLFLTILSGLTVRQYCEMFDDDDP